MTFFLSSFFYAQAWPWKKHVSSESYKRNNREGEYIRISWKISCDRAEDNPSRRWKL
jgi:hypothetical protein